MWTAKIIETYLKKLGRNSPWILFGIDMAGRCDLRDDWAQCQYQLMTQEQKEKLHQELLKEFEREESFKKGKEK